MAATDDVATTRLATSHAGHRTGQRDAGPGQPRHPAVPVRRRFREAAGSHLRRPRPDRHVRLPEPSCRWTNASPARRSTQRLRRPALAQVTLTKQVYGIPEFNQVEILMANSALLQVRGLDPRRRRRHQAGTSIDAGGGQGAVQDRTAASSRSSASTASCRSSCRCGPRPTAPTCYRPRKDGPARRPEGGRGAASSRAGIYTGAGRVRDA